MKYVLKNQLRRLRFFIIPSAAKRSKILKKAGFFNEMGNDVFFQPRKLPADPQYIRFHNNISVAANVTFITHDVMHGLFKNIDNENDYYSHLGCIEVMDNVFIGAGSIILPDVRIGPNAIVAAGSVVVKDVPPGSIVGGDPAKVIGNFNELMKKRKEESEEIKVFDRNKRASVEWEKFYSKRL